MANNNQLQKVQPSAGQMQEFISYKNQLTTSVMNKISALQKGGVQVPAGFSAQNQIYLAFLKLTAMTTRDGKPVLSAVKPQSVANALLTMCIKGLSLEKGQCAFIQYGDELQFQEEYHGKIALAKRCGAGDPQAQVIYEGDVFEYIIDPATGKKQILKHEQKLGNIDPTKIVGAWCIVPYADGKQEPKVDIMTMAEIRQSWMQGATKGQSPAHKNFPGEMAKKTVISRACKLFYSTSDDAGIYEENETRETPDNQGEDVNFEAMPMLSEGAAKSATAVIENEAAKPSAPAPQPRQKAAPAEQPIQVPEPTLDDAPFEDAPFDDGGIFD